MEEGSAAMSTRADLVLPFKVTDHEVSLGRPDSVNTIVYVDCKLCLFQIYNSQRACQIMRLVN